MSIHFDGRSLLCSPEWGRFASELSALAGRMAAVRAQIAAVEQPRKVGLRAQLRAMEKERDRLVDAQEALGETPPNSGAALVAELVNELIQLLVEEDRRYRSLCERFSKAPIDAFRWCLGDLFESAEIIHFLGAVLTQINDLTTLRSAAAVVFVLQSHLDFLAERVLSDCANFYPFSSVSVGLEIGLRQMAKAKVTCGFISARVRSARELIESGRVVGDEAGFDLSLHLEEEFPDGLPSAA